MAESDRAERKSGFMPPSYSPEGYETPRNRAESRSLPPSYTPSSTPRYSRQAPHGVPLTRVHGEHPLYDREPRVAAWSTRTVHHRPSYRTTGNNYGDDGYVDNNDDYDGYDYDGYGYDGNRGYGRNRPYRRYRDDYRDGYRRGNYPAYPERNWKPRHHRHRFLKTIGIIIVLLLAALLALGVWANSQLNRFTALTEKSNDSAETWLILGSDARDGTVGGTAEQVPGERTDTSMLLVKPRTGSSALISIPRDTLVSISGRRMKLNAVAELTSWPQLSGAVEDISGLKVNHVVKIGFSGVTDVVDALGGVQLCYNRTVNDVRSGMQWTAGCHMANGQQALAFSRMRYSDPEGDFGRTKRQRQVVQAVMAKALTPSTLLNPLTVSRLVSSGLHAITVDNSTNILSLARMAFVFREATGPSGITGLPPIESMGYYVPSVGSCVLLNHERTLELFSAIGNGTQSPGVVGGLGK